MSAQFPLADLCHSLHIRSDDEPELAQLLPRLSYSLGFSISSAPDATSSARANAFRSSNAVSAQ